MKNIEFLVSSSELAIGKEGNALRCRFLRNACKLIEKEINEDGGIAGKGVVIHYKHVPYGMGSGLKRADALIEFIRKNPNVICMNGAAAASSNEKILQEINLDQIIYFSGSSVGEFHPNRFKTTLRSDEVNAELITQLIEALDNNSNIYFLHRGIRTATFESDFTPADRNRLVSQDFSGIKEKAEIKNKVAEVLARLKDSDIVILDLDGNVLKPAIDYFNETGKQSVVWSFFGALEGRYSNITFPLRQSNPDCIFRDLDFENLINTTVMPVTVEEKALLGTSNPALEFPSLVAYASKKAGLIYSDKEQFVSDISDAINTIDGKNDIFIGKGTSYAFKDNVNILKATYLYTFPSSLQTPGNYPKLFYPEQISVGIDGSSMLKVTYVNIDVLRATNIDIGTGIWSCEFNLDIVSPYDDPIETIKFNNLSSINPKFESKLIWEEQVVKEENSLRYYVVANFDFIPLADNYPFDQQHIFISFSISDKNKYGIIQPIPEVLLDRDFKIDGWRLIEATTGVLRRKEVIHKGKDFIKTVETTEEARVGWTLARANSVTLMKIGIPLSFLLFLNYYTLFRGFEGIGGSVGILTTAFLSGIALYFSTERPQPLRMTTVDLIFLWYYVLTGVTIVATSISSLLSEEMFILAMTGLKIAVPIGVIGIVTFLLRRIKSNRLKPRIN